MNLRNKAVEAAYMAGKYTDHDGNQWRRGLEGWFLDDVDGKGGVMLCYHHDMAEKIERENPEG